MYRKLTRYLRRVLIPDFGAYDPNVYQAPTLQSTPVLSASNRPGSSSGSQHGGGYQRASSIRGTILVKVVEVITDLASSASNSK